MLNLKKEATQLKTIELQIASCPVCKAYVSHVYFMQDSTTKKQSKWYSCSCGVVFNEVMPDKIYDLKYWDKYNEHDNKIKPAYEYPIRLYAPIIEELIYGRRVLLVGKVTSHQEDLLAYRGWVPTSIDKNPSTSAHIISDIEEYKFPESIKYNLIWFYQTFECMKKPLETLDLCSKLLAEDGIIFIASPDTDFIHTRGSSGYIHWKPDMHYMMWNRRSISTYLEKLGFQIVLCRQNYEPRFPAHDDYHLIAQRKFF